MSKTVERIALEKIISMQEGNFDLSPLEMLTQINSIVNEVLTTTPSPDVAGSDAVAFAEWKEGRYEHYDTITSEGKSWLTWVTPENALVWTKETPEFTTAQLYAKFREEHPQLAGENVEQAAVIEALQFCKANLVQAKEYDRAVIIRELEERITSGAAFQAAQGVGVQYIPFNDTHRKEGWYHISFEGAPAVLDINNGDLIVTIPNGRVFTNPSIDKISVLQPAPAAVSAGTWVKYPELLSLPAEEVQVLIRYNEKKDRALGDRHLIKELYENGWEDVEWLDESAPGIPDVRELVEALEKIVKLAEDNINYRTTLANEMYIAAQTALAGIKGK